MFIIENKYDGETITQADIYEMWECGTKDDGTCEGESFLYFLSSMIADLSEDRTEYALVYGSWEELWKIYDFCMERVDP